MGEKRMLTIKEVAELLEISQATVNYYTNLGLFSVVDRKGNSRLYNQHDLLVRFKEIKQLRKQGYSLKLIQDKLSETLPRELGKSAY